MYDIISLNIIQYFVILYSPTVQVLHVRCVPLINSSFENGVRNNK